MIEYSKNYSKAAGSLWNYYNDKQKSGAVGYIIYSSRDSKSKTNITGRLEGNNIEKEIEIVVRLMLTLMLILQ